MTNDEKSLLIEFEPLKVSNISPQTLREIGSNLIEIADQVEAGHLVYKSGAIILSINSAKPIECLTHNIYEVRLNSNLVLGQGSPPDA